MGLVACGGEPPPRARPLKRGLAQDAQAGAKDPASDQTQNPDARAAEPTAGESKVDDPLRDDSLDGAGPDDGAFSAEELAMACDLGTTQPTAPLWGGDFIGMPITVTGRTPLLNETYTATLLTTLRLATTLSEQQVELGFTNLDVNPARVRATAEAQANGLTGATRFAMGTLEERAALHASAGPWRGLGCAVAPVSGLTLTGTGGTTTSVRATFAPALPVYGSPRLGAAGHGMEMGEERVFPGITASVLESAVTDVTVGSTYTGTVTLKTIEPSYSATFTDLGTVTVGGDMAFEVRTDFGSPAITRALGLWPVVRYYIDTRQGRYKAVVIEFGDPTISPAVFVAQ